MQRTLNFTGRARIDQKKALFSFPNPDETPPQFDVSFNFEPGEYPSDATVYVEAYYKETRQRFCFGKFGCITPPTDRRLDQIDLSGPTLFRVLVVDESGQHGKLLGSGDQFKAESGDDATNRSSLLAVRKYDLGQIPWRLHIDPGGAPELHMNSRIQDAVARLKTDPVFQALILPAVLKEILIWYLWNDEDREDNDYCERWMQFASSFAGENPDPDDPVESWQWIDEVIRGFTDQFHLGNMLVEHQREEG